MKRRLLFLCAFCISEFLIAQKIGQITQGASVLESSLWPDKTCNVCWENPSGSDVSERAWVKDAIKSTWEKESNFRFTGWGTCEAASKGIRIRISDVGPNCAELGSKLDGLVNGMTLNFTFNNWSTDCRSKREYCIRAIAVHEFGHALGFAHEQNRTDAPSLCQEEAQGSDGDWWVTPYDVKSVMNYCNPNWNNAGQLSEFDKYGIHLLYGGPIVESPIIYAIDKEKNLLWYKHTGYLNGSFSWAANTGGKVGRGWSFVQAFDDGEGHVYAIKDNGDLLWYNHNGYRDGSFKWSDSSGKKVGEGWYDIQAAFAGGGGVIYLIKKNGELLWYKHLGYMDGSKRWYFRSGRKVGDGWTDFHAAFSGGNGVIYLIAKNGDLYWYKHAGFNNGAYSWYGGATNKVGSGWNAARQVFSTGWGRIYLIEGDGKLRYYNHAGYLDGTYRWGNGTGNVVGSGWLGVTAVGMGTMYAPTLTIINTTQDINVFRNKPF